MIRNSDKGVDYPYWPTEYIMFSQTSIKLGEEHKQIY